MEQTLSELNAITTIDNNDIVYVVAAGVSYKMTIGELKANLAPFTEAIPITAGAAHLTFSPLAIVCASANGGALNPGAGNDYTISGQDVTMINGVNSGILLITYYK